MTKGRGLSRRPGARRSHQGYRFLGFGAAAARKARANAALAPTSWFENIRSLLGGNITPTDPTMATGGRGRGPKEQRAPSEEIGNREARRKVISGDIL